MKHNFEKMIIGRVKRCAKIIFAKKFIFFGEVMKVKY